MLFNFVLSAFELYAFQFSVFELSTFELPAFELYVSKLSAFELFAYNNSRSAFERAAFVVRSNAFKFQVSVAFEFGTFCF